MRNLERGEAEKKAWLFRYTELKEEIERERESAEYWRERSLSLGANSFDDMGIKSANVMTMPDYIIKFDELAKDCVRLAEEAEREKLKIREAISGLKDIRQRRVLSMKYLDGMEFDEIAEKMNYSQAHIWVIHGKALKNLEIK